MKEYTLVTVGVRISQFTSPVTMTCRFVTWRVVQTVTTAVVDTVISIGTIVTLCNNLYQ